MFVVGIYAGEDKLGEGFGSSLRMAEYRVRQPILTVYLVHLLIQHTGRRRRSPPSLPDTPATTPSEPPHFDFP
jgi:hypothetical protein